MPLQATSGAASYDGFGGGVAVVPAYIESCFSTYLYTGNGSTQTITNGIDLSTKGGLVWTKDRTNGLNHALYDTVRGAGSELATNTTNAASSESGFAFLSTGYSFGARAVLNFNGGNYVSWTFREQPKFFDVVTYTGTGSARTVAHNLGSVPGCIIVKRTDNISDWAVYHRSLNGGTNPQDYYVTLNNTSAQSTSSWFGNTAPTSTVFSVDPSGGATNQSGATYVAYLFAHDAGGFGLTGTDNVISCGSYTTDGSGNATINLGYEPQWLLVKNTSAPASWIVVDNMRGFGSATDSTNRLNPNTSGAEITGSTPYYVTSTGFTAESGPSVNFIYIAIRRGPMKVPTLGTSVYQPIAYTGNGNSVRSFTGVGFPPDLVFPIMRASPGNHYLGDRLRGSGILKTTATDAEDSGYVKSYDQDGWTTQADSFGNSYGYAFIDYLFRRAPGFFDEVCYTGTGTAGQTYTHNLGVVPELMIVKCRSNTGDWMVYNASMTYDQVAFLDLTNAFSSSPTIWYSEPNSSAFFVGSSTRVNVSSRNYVAYLFATCAGVSKVGSYTGTGTTKQIDCGFTGGARFVLIKKTSGTGSWYVWDSARGIVSGNDPYLLLNSTAAEVTNTDYIDTYSAGFEISSTAPSEINENGGSFIFLAIS